HAMGSRAAVPGDVEYSPACDGERRLPGAGYGSLRAQDGARLLPALGLVRRRSARGLVATGHTRGLYGSRSTGSRSCTLRPVNIAEISVPPSRNSATTAAAMWIAISASSR